MPQEALPNVPASISWLSEIWMVWEFLYPTSLFMEELNNYFKRIENHSIKEEYFNLLLSYQILKMDMLQIIPLWKLI